jgi:succinate-acetate transporter protein
MGFGATTFILSMYNVQARGITTPNVVMGMALGYGGLVQLIAGIEEFVCGNTFAATAFSSYGGFWLSFASTYISSRFYSALLINQHSTFHRLVSLPPMSPRENWIPHWPYTLRLGLSSL